MTNLDSILKSRDITLPTKVHLVKAMVFPVVKYGCESWTVKTAEHRKIDAFELCWRRLLRVPWTARRFNQSILRKSVPGVHWKDWCWSWNSSTLATSCEVLTHWKRAWCWEGLESGGEGDNRGWDGWMASSTQWTWVWVNSGSWWWTRRLVYWDSWGCKESDMTERLNWAELRTGKSNLSNHSGAGFWRELLTGKGQEGTIWDGNALYLDFGGAYIVIPHCQTPYTISLKFMYFIYWKLNINNNNISSRIATYKINK